MQTLVVEGNATTRARLVRVLVQRGHEVAAVTSAEAALRLCEMQQFDLMVIDWMLPGFHGLELCAMVRDLPDGAWPVILISTARESPDDLAAVLGVGATDYLPKSASADMLLIRLAVAERQAHDVAQRRRAELQLRASESRFRALSDQSNDLVLVIAPDGIARYVSPSHRRVLHYAADSLLGVEVLHFVHPADRRRALRAYAEALRHPTDDVTVEVRVRHSDGTWRSLEMVASNHLDDPSIGGLMVNGRDVTARNLIEEERRESEERFRRIVYGAPVAMAITNGEDEFELVNDAYSALFGYRSGDLVGKKFSILVPPHHDDCDSLSQAEQSLLDLEGQQELELITRSMDLITVLSTVFTIASADGRSLRVSYALDITERKRAELRLVEMAHYDQLTGLPNRVLLHDRLAQAIGHATREHSPLAVLFLDLDGFKKVNDDFGHNAGDRLLQLVARRLSACIRATDTAARLAGDEFVVMLPNSARGIDPSRVAAKILQSLAQPFEFQGHSLAITVSIGIAVFDSDTRWRDPAVLLKRADAAMYVAKRLGKNRYAYDEDPVRPHDERRGMVGLG